MTTEPPIPIRPRRRTTPPTSTPPPAPSRTNGQPPPSARPPEADSEPLAPWSLEAEQSVLGAILIDNSVLERVTGILQPAHFYRRPHHLVYENMLALQRDRTPIDLVTLSAEIRRRKQAEEIGGSAYLARLMNQTPTAVHAEHYARIVAMKALARRAITDAGRIAAIGYEDSNDPDELLSRLRSTVDGIVESWAGSAGSPIERLGARFLHTLSTDPPPPMLLDRLDPLGHTILYGTGGVGKGTLASSWVVGLLHAGMKVLIVDYENHPDEWARRIYGIGGPELMDGVLHVAPLTASWNGKRGPLWVQAPELRQLVIAFGADAMLVDSVVPACGGTDALKPEAAALYAGGLEFIGKPALSLAHVTKEHDLRYPFGSVFWHNLARTTWSLKAVGGQTMLTHRKHNNYAKLPRQLVQVTFTDSGMPAEVWERSASEQLSGRISYLLSDQALTSAQIVDLLNEDLDEDDEPVKVNSVRVALNRGMKTRPPKFEKTGSGSSERWSNA